MPNYTSFEFTIVELGRLYSIPESELSSLVDYVFEMGYNSHSELVLAVQEYAIMYRDYVFNSFDIDIKKSKSNFKKTNMPEWF